MPRHRPAQLQPLPPDLVWLAHAARRECPQGHGAALLALGALAAIKVPSRGVLWYPRDEEENDLHEAIRVVADQHLGLTKPETAFYGALDAIMSKTTWEEGNALEGLHLQAKGISNTAHYYAGLAFGITFIERRGWWR